VMEFVGVFTADGGSAIVPESDIQFTITDLPSEDYSATCLLSDEIDSLEGILPNEEGMYSLTIAVLDCNEEYTVSSQ